MRHTGFQNTIFSLSLSAIALLIVLFISTTGLTASKQPNQNKTLLVGANKYFKPFEFLNEKGEPDGFTIDLMKAVAKAEGLDIKFILDNWSSTRRDLKDNKIDAVTGMMYSTERAKIFDFSVPNIIIPYAIFVRNGSSIKILSDVEEKEIIVVKNVYAHDWLTRNKTTDSIIVVKTPNKALQLLASGKHDCAIIPRLHGLDLLDDLNISNVFSVGPPVLWQKLSFAVSKGNSELLSKFNQGIFSLHQTGEYDDIYLKWFSVNKQNKQIRKAAKYVLLIFSLIIAALLTVLFWNWLLKRTVRSKTKEIRQNEARLKQIIEGIPIPTYVIDENRKVTHWNMACEFLTGETAEKIVGTKNYHKAFHDRQTYSIVDLLLDNVLTKHSQQHDDITYRESSVLAGSYETEMYFKNLGIDGKWLYGAAVLLKDETGKIIGAIETWQDLTESKQLEKQLIQSQKMEALGTLAGGIAHDFNNVLMVINVQSQMALRDITSESLLNNRLEQILAAGRRAEKLVKQILTFSRQAEIETEPIQISTIVIETLTLFRTSLPSNIEIHQDILCDDLVMADTTHIHQIVMNLCTNACHAMSDTGGVLEIALSEVQIDEDDLKINLKPGKFIKLTIGDTGHGIPPEIQNKILDPFFTTKQRGEGTGMGLSVTHGIVKQYGGTINFVSEPGKGTTFHIYFPIYQN
jgi:two-component system sensor histidine kinase EvgS